MKVKVSVRRCLNYDLSEVERSVEECLELLGGAEAFFKRGERVLLKPNLLTDAVPEEAITTHPNFVRAVARALKRAGLDVAVADIPADHRLETDVERVYRKTGMREMADAEGIALLSDPKFVEEDGVIFGTWVKEFDHLISLPKFKTHTLTTLTGAVKNMFGLTPRLYRIHLHKKYLRTQDFARMLVGVFQKCRPTLSFVDGIVGMEGNGPAHGGVPKTVKLVAASADAVALDSVLASIMGLAPEDVATNKEGKSVLAGVADLKDIEIVGDAVGIFKKDGFQLPPGSLLSRLPPLAVEFLNLFAEFRPRVEKSKCNGCRICIENCPVSAIGLANKQAKIDYSKCVDCFCCLEVCPIGAMKTKTGPLIKSLEVLKAVKRRMDSFRASAARLGQRGESHD